MEAQASKQPYAFSFCQEFQRNAYIYKCVCVFKGIHTYTHAYTYTSLQFLQFQVILTVKVIFSLFPIQLKEESIS